MTPKEVYSLMCGLNMIYDIVRIVDPQLMEVIVVNSNGDIFTDQFKCHEVWNKSERCENCISLKACRSKARQEKFEFIGDEVYHVTVVPVIIGSSTYALEIVSHIEDNVFINAFGRQQFAAIVNKFNHYCGSDDLLSENKRNAENILQSVTDSEPEAETGTLANIKILIADDDETAELLRSAEADVVSVHSGIETINEFTYHSADPFDVIMLNISMTDMSGIETAATIRNMDLIYADAIPLIAISDKNDEEQKKICIEAGINGLLQKPVSLNDVMQTIMNCMKYQSDMLRQKLVISKQKANVDPLTGVRNITAYTGMISELTEKTRTYNDFHFAIVLFDVNGLTNINETYGHDVGDTFIRNCCNIICDVFNHSPVFRIGGDEFAVVLYGDDYDIRSRLMSEISQRIDFAQKISNFSEGAASFAYGIAEYESSKNDCISHVLRRAEEDMLERKSVMNFSNRSS